MTGKNGKKKEIEEKVVEAIDEMEADDALITLSTGVVLRGKAAPAMALIKVKAHFLRPKPPLWKSETLGRMIENPDDPIYKEQLDNHKTESTAAMLNTLILLGTDLVSVPKGFPKPESDDWLDELYEIGIEIHPEKKRWRYLNWVMFKAAPKSQDTELISEVVGRLSGVSERDVQAAEEFPGSP